MRRTRRKATSKPKIEMVSYNSISELYEHIKSTKQKSAWRTNSIFNKSYDYIIKFAGETPEDAMEKFFKGDAEAAKKIKAEGEILNEAQGGMMPKIEVGVYGCIPSVPNYLRGVPANMMRVVREPRRNPVIDIYVENSIYDGIDVDEVAKKAAIIANVITATEMEGVRVNLWSVNTSHDRDNNAKYAMICRIKDADAPLNLLNIAFCVCNRAMHRSVFLAWLERHSDKRIDGYGRPMRGYEIQPDFGVDGIVLSMRDMVDECLGIDDVTKKINDYLKTK